MNDTTKTEYGPAIQIIRRACGITVNEAGLCSACGRQYDPDPEGLGLAEYPGRCHSDDCPSHEVTASFLNRLSEQFDQSMRDAELAFGRAREACENRAEAADWAMSLCLTERWDTLAAVMGSGIIALNEACRVLGIPAHERTAAAVAQWEGN